MKKTIHVLVIDGQGGQIGSVIVREIRKRYPEIQLTAVGTNTVATAAMLKAGANQGATGENPVLVACRGAQAIIGPIGIVIADSMLGEITPAMALAVSRADVPKILIPTGKCNNIVAGAAGTSMSALIEDGIYQLGIRLGVSE